MSARIGRIRTILGFIMVIAVAALIAPGMAQATTSGFSDCPSGNVCFWTGDNGTGSRCTWSVDDPDWQGGNIRCSWAATRTAQSVYNHGTSGRSVSYYTGANYSGSRAGCTAAGGQGNFQGNQGNGYFLRSHKWEC
jgi:peptidase inhibitor family I36